MGLGVVSLWSVHGLCPFSTLSLWALPLLAPHSYLGCVTCISPPMAKNNLPSAARSAPSLGPRAPWRPHPSSPTGGPEGCPVRTVSTTLPPSTVCSTAGYGSVHPVLVQPPKIHPPLTCAREGQRCAGFWLPYLHANKKKWHLKGRGAGWAMTGHRDAQAQPQAGSTAEHRCLRTQTPGDRGGKPANVSTNTNQQDGAASKMAAKSEYLSSTLRAHLQDRDSCPLTSM